MYSHTTATTNSELADLWAILKTASNEGDSATFSEAIHSTDWELFSAEQFANAVTLALGAGEHVVARALATQGNLKYPESSILAKMARVLAPPKIVKG